MKRIFSSLFVKYLLLFIGVLLITNVFATIIGVFIFDIGGEGISYTPFNNRSGILLIFAGRIGFMAFSIGAIFIFFAVKLVVKPIKNITEASKRLARGDFNITLVAKGSDEIAELTNNFNIMVTELSKNEYLHKSFVSNVSHEFKTPVTSLMGYAKLLKDDSLSSDKRNEYADIIINESKRLSTLSSDLLQLSELENGHIKLKKQTYRLDEQLCDVIALMQNQWEEKNIELDLDLAEMNITADKELLHRVWVNLLSNAIKYTDTKIKISAFKDEKIIVTFEDNGSGINDDEIENIFKRFYKADKSRNSCGTGLGLPICKRIIELHGGKITAVSKINTGSCFSVFIK